MKKILVSVLFSALFFVVGGAKSGTINPFSDNSNVQNPKSVQFAGCIADWFATNGPNDQANCND